MEIKLYNTKSDKRMINKTLNNEKAITGTLKDILPLTDITLVIDYSTINDYNIYNYAKINNYYYFITNKKYINNNFIEFTLHIDVLMSFKTEILNLTCVLKRSETLYNRYLYDDKYKINSYKRIRTKTFPNSFTPIPTPILITTAKGV